MHFVQEPIDQGSLVRPYMKWEWTLPSGVVVKEALRRAHTIMETKPAGPVYFMAQRETLTQKWASDQIRSYAGDQFSQPQSGGADPAMIAQLADKLIAAEHPILVCGYAGQSKNAPKLIEELAMFAGIAVFEGNQTFNISHEFPCFLGYSPNKHLPQGRRRPAGGRRRAVVPGRRVAQGQVVLGAYRRRHAEVGVADVDLPGQSPHAGRLRRHPRAAAGGAEEEGHAEVHGGRQEARRGAQLPNARLGATQPRRWRPTRASQGEINPHYLFAELNKLLKADDIVCNEGVRNAGACLLQLERPEPNTCVRSGGGGLGWSGGMALGCKLAAPDKMVRAGGRRRRLLLRRPELGVRGGEAIQAADPGAAARQHRLVGGEGIDLRVFPEGEAKSADKFQASLMPDAEFSKIGEAFGAYGEKVTNPDDVPAALARAVKEVRGGRAAILHVRVTKL